MGAKGSTTNSGDSHSYSPTSCRASSAREGHRAHRSRAHRTYTAIASSVSPPHRKPATHARAAAAMRARRRRGAGPRGGGGGGGGGARPRARARARAALEGAPQAARATRSPPPYNAPPTGPSTRTRTGAARPARIRRRRMAPGPNPAPGAPPDQPQRAAARAPAPAPAAAQLALRAAVAAAAAAGGITPAQAARIGELLQPPPPPPPRARQTLAAPRAAAVRLPASARIFMRFGLLTATSRLRAHLDAGGAGAEALLTDGKFALGLTCADMYNLGYTKANIALSPLVLLGTPRLEAWPLGQLARCFGFTAHELLAPLGVAHLNQTVEPAADQPPAARASDQALDALAALFATAQTAESFGAAGLSAQLLQQLGCDMPMLQLLSFGAKDMAAYMGLTYAIARDMGFTNACCDKPGWSFSEVRAALHMTKAEAEECGLTVQHFLVVPGVR
jgi:hypothetical protein